MIDLRDILFGDPRCHTQWADHQESRQNGVPQMNKMTISKQENVSIQSKTHNTGDDQETGNHLEEKNIYSFSQSSNNIVYSNWNPVIIFPTLRTTGFYRVDSGDLRSYSIHYCIVDHYMIFTGMKIVNKFNTLFESGRIKRRTKN